MKDEILKTLLLLRDEIQTHLVMSKQERAHIFEAISHAAQHQNQGAADTLVSPYGNQITRKKPLKSHIFFMNYASISLAMCLVIAGSISFAAEKALPGDPLYVVKTNFNENIQSLLTFSSQSKARLEAQLAERRLVEAQKLAVSNNLSAEAEAQIQVNLKKHTDEFTKNINEVKDKENPAAAASLSADFRSRLMAHQNVLDSLENEGTISASNFITEKIASIDSMRKDAEAELALLSPSEVRKAATSKLIDAEEAIRTLQVSIDRPNSISENVRAEVDAHIVVAQGKIAQGVVFDNEEKYIDAYISFQEALLSVQEAERTIATLLNLDVGTDTKDQVIRSVVNRDIPVTTAASAAATSTDQATTTEETIEGE